MSGYRSPATEPLMAADLAWAIKSLKVLRNDLMTSSFVLVLIYESIHFSQALNTGSSTFSISLAIEC